MEVTRLTEHWTLEELCYSETAEKLGIDNMPDVEQAVNLRVLAEEVLEPARVLIGRPMTSSSGFRCQKLNGLVGGEPESQHLRGEADDFTCEDMDGAYQQIAASNIDFDQLIRESKGGHDWIHVSKTSRRVNRRQCLVIDDNGTRTYEPPR